MSKWITWAFEQGGRHFSEPINLTDDAERIHKVYRERRQVILTVDGVCYWAWIEAITLAGSDTPEGERAAASLRLVGLSKSPAVVAEKGRQ